MTDEKKTPQAGRPGTQRQERSDRGVFAGLVKQIVGQSDGFSNIRQDAWADKRQGELISGHSAAWLERGAKRGVIRSKTIVTDQRRAKAFYAIADIVALKATSRRRPAR